MEKRFFHVVNHELDTRRITIEVCTEDSAEALCVLVNVSDAYNKEIMMQKRKIYMETYLSL